ncbi:MAG: Lrp/AsnC family transcriptional regulator [Betaproteobacteria bacterium]|nr:Lrp/AsnC family transcriptional regulator [Betaproteobacteria bacterium]
MLAPRQIYDHIQRGFPLLERPYQHIGATLGYDEQTVLELLAQDLEAGRISRIGAIFAPNVIGASTLAALAVPPEQLDRVAQQISARTAVSHNYGRSGHRYNLWFVAGARNRTMLDEELTEIAAETGYAPLDLRLEREFHVDLGFTLSAPHSPHRSRRAVTVLQPQELSEDEWRLVAALEAGLPLTPRPYAALSLACHMSQAEVVAHLTKWQESGLIRRFGVILNHRRFGYVHNSMCVWDLPADRVDAIGERFAQLPQVTLCYRRTRRLPHWPYNLFAMVHARDAGELEQALTAFAREESAPHAVLTSHTCYKQRGTRYAYAQQVTQ